MSNSQLFEDLYIAKDTQGLDREFPMYPLNSPGLPAPGINFAAHAVALGDPPPVSEGAASNRTLLSYGPKLEYLYRRALYDSAFSMPVAIKSSTKIAKLVPGHIWGDDTRDMSGGPRPARVMIVTKSPGRDETSAGRYLVGDMFRSMVETFRSIGVDDITTGSMYVTAICKWPALTPQSDAVPKAHLTDCAMLLHQELRIVQPDFILCLGSDAGKWFLGTGGSVSSMVGRADDYEYYLHRRGEPFRSKKAKVVVCPHPAALFRQTELFPDFRDQLMLLQAIIGGADVGGYEKGIKHRNVYKLRELRTIVDKIRSNPDPRARIIAVDGEWDGQDLTDPSGYIRTIQFSAADKEAYCVVLRHQGGSPAFKPNIESAIGELKRLLKTDAAAGYYPRPGGHYFRADLPWLRRQGLDLLDEYAPPSAPALARSMGGWDTSHMLHANNETAAFNLTAAMTRWTAAPVYDKTLKGHVDAYCKKHDLKRESLEGYGMLPAWILHPEPTDVEGDHNYSCLHKEARVQLADGSWQRISDLVKQKYDGKVKAFLNGQVCDASVTGWHRHEVNQKDWRVLRTDSTLRGRHGLLGPRLTPDHKVLTQRGKVRVDQLLQDEDCILTDEKAFSADQLSVFVASLLGDGGFCRKNNRRVGFGFGQTGRRSAYAEWKAEVFSNLNPQLRNGWSRGEQSRYETPYTKYLTYLNNVWPTHSYEEHASRKLVITRHALETMGMLGLAVWYQDDGILVANAAGQRHTNCRIVCKASEAEITIALDWFRAMFGDAVNYNVDGKFFQFYGDAFPRMQAAIRPFVHPVFTYKVVYPVEQAPVIEKSNEFFFEPVREVVSAPVTQLAGRGHGVRYCLTVEGAGNFLTTAGFVSNCYDADVTRRIAMRFMEPGGPLDQDEFGNSSWEPYWLTHTASLGVLQMEMTGIALDKKRVDELTEMFIFVYDNLLANFRSAINWPDFTPDSPPQCVAFMFGDSFSQKIDPVTKEPLCVRPPGALTLNLTPIKTTGKRSKLWEDVVRKNEQDAYSPSTDKEVLGILGHAHPLAMQLRDLKFIGQVLKGALRKPNMLDHGAGWEVDEDGNNVYDKGVPGSVNSDGMVRTHISQNKETGRYSSARPNLQAISKRREGDYARICGYWKDGDNGTKVPAGDYLHIFPTPMYKHQIRSIFKASPGCVLVEADYIGAELAAIGWLAGDPVLTDQVRRNCLPESHPDYYEIHSQAAVKAFRLDCEPTKKGLKSIGKLPLRVAAKNVKFGIPYGRGAEAIARQCREEGVDVTVAECQQLVDAYFEEYPHVAAYLERVKLRTQNERWLAGAFGRLRRFNKTTERSVIGDQERQGCNFGIQNCVADGLTTAIANFYRYSFTHEDCRFYLTLPVHDALLFNVPIAYIKRFCKDTQLPDGSTQRALLYKCMVDDVPIWPRHLDNTPMQVAAPYHFGIDVDVQLSWGESITEEQAERIGLDLSSLDL